MFYCNEDRTADDRRDAEKSENWTFTFPVSGEEGAAQGCDKLDCPKRYVEEDRLEGVIAERLDNERSESGDATTWDARESELAESSPRARLGMLGIELVKMVPKKRSALIVLLI
jgi:hypothetical protein